MEWLWQVFSAPIIDWNRVSWNLGCTVVPTDIWATMSKAVLEGVLGSRWRHVGKMRPHVLAQSFGKVCTGSTWSPQGDLQRGFDAGAFSLQLLAPTALPSTAPASSSFCCRQFPCKNGRRMAKQFSRPFTQCQSPGVCPLPPPPGTLGKERGRGGGGGGRGPP